MTDFLSSVPSQPFEAPDSAANESYGATAPSTTEKIGAAMAEGPTDPTAKFSLSRWLTNAQYLDGLGAKLTRQITQGAYDETIPAFTPSDIQRFDFTTKKEAPVLSADEANTRFAPQGPDGKPQPITDKPLPEPVAQSLGEARKAQIEREGIFRRYENSHGWVVNRLTDMGAMLDPLNASSMLVPGIGEEAFLGQFARVGVEGVAARTLARVGAGATAGAAGMVPLATLNLGLSQAEGTDFGIRDFMSDVLMGAAFGATIHGGLVGGYREFRYARSGRAIGPGFPEPPKPPEAPKAEPPPEGSTETFKPKDEAAFHADVGDALDERLRDLGLTREDVSGLHQFYERRPGETPAEALDRSIDDQIDAHARDILANESIDHDQLQRDADELETQYRSEGFTHAPFVGGRYDINLAGISESEARFQGGTELPPGPTPRFFRPYTQEEIPFHPNEADIRPGDVGKDPFENHAAMSAAVAQVIEGRPVDVLPLFDHAAERPEIRSLPIAQTMLAKELLTLPEGAVDSATVGRIQHIADEIARLGGDFNQVLKDAFEHVYESGQKTEGLVGFGAQTAQTVTRQAMERMKALLAERQGDRTTARTTADVASQQRQTWRNGFASGMPQSEFDAAREAIYPMEGQHVEREGGPTTGTGGRTGQAGGGKAGSGEGGKPAAAGRGGSAEPERAGAAVEPGAEGKPQQLIPGVQPITDRERAQLGTEKPLKGGEAPPPEGGLFDEAARAQQDIFDRLGKTDPDLAEALKQLEGKELHPEDRAEIEAATAEVAKAERLEDAYEQAATCIIEGEA